MQSTVTRKNAHTLTLTIKESGVELEKAKKLVFEEIRTKWKVKGFKQGSSIPDAVILREYGEEMITQQALDQVINRIYPKILKKENIIPVAPANITEVKSTDPIEITLEIEVFPEIEIDTKKLDKIKVAKTPVVVDTKEVDTEIDAIKARFTHFHGAGEHTEDGADTSHLSIEKGDRVTITAQGYEKRVAKQLRKHMYQVILSLLDLVHLFLDLKKNSLVQKFEMKLVLILHFQKITIVKNSKGKKYTLLQILKNLKSHILLNLQKSSLKNFVV